MKQIRLVRRVPTSWGLALILAAGCSADGCGCTEPTPGGFPSAERTDNAVQVRVTPTGIASIEADPAALVGSFLGTDGNAFPLPSTCGGDPEICCDNGQPVDPCGPVLLDFDPQAGDAPRLEINPTNGSSRVQVVTRMRIRTGADIPIRTQGQDCEISIDTTDSGNESVEIVLDIDVAVDPATNVTELSNVNATVNDLANGDFDLGGGLVCTLADVLLKGTIRNQLIAALEGALEDTIAELACKQCPSGDVADCGEFGDACDSGTCMRAGACLQELGLAGRVLGDKAFAGFSSGQLGAMDMYEVAGGYSESTNGGLSLGVMSGAIAAGTDRDRCGPSGTQPPMQTTLPRSSFFTGNTRPDTGNAFGIGIGLHQYNLDLFSYSAYESGLLCLNIGPAAVDLLTSETFAIIMPSLLDLAHGQPAPVTLGLRPQSAPVMTLGAGTTLPSGDIDEPLINLSMPGLEIDFFAMIDDQWIRVMTLISDVTLPINLEVDDTGALAPVIGAGDGTFANLSVKNSEALSESPDELAEKFPLILDLALPMLADGLSIDLPLLGSLELQVQPDGITSIESNTMLAIFADLAVTSPGARDQRRAQTTAAIKSITLPERYAFASPHRYSDQRPRVEVEFGGAAPSGAPLEWSYRLNGSVWSPYSSEARREIDNRVLWLQGRHNLEVRAREIGAGHTTDATPARLEVPIDRVGPRLKRVQLTSSMVMLSASDYVDQSALTFEYQLDGQTSAPRAWQRVENVPANTLIAVDLEGTSADDAKFRVIDSTGNSSDTITDDLIAFHGAGDGGGCECDSTSGGAGTWLLVALCGLLLGLGRRRTQTLVRVTKAAAKPIAVLGLFALLSLTEACSCGSGSDCGELECMDGEVSRGPTGRWLSAASNSERNVLAGYDEKLGDLVLIDVTDDGELSYTAVDGIPEGVPSSFQPDGYRGGVSAEGPDVGGYTSVALEGDSARVAYQDLDEQSLKYVTQDGSSFNAHEVDIAGARSGLYNSLVLRGGVPTIAFQVVGVDGDGGVKFSQLRMATADSSEPFETGSWTTTVIEEVAISCAGLCDDSLSCAIADPEVGPACLADTADCATACGEDATCVGAVCLDVIAPASSADLPPGTGLFANNVTLADGRAAVIYYRRSTGDLMAAVDVGGTWELTELDATPATDTGASVAAVLGTDGAVHIAYQDAIGDRVMYLAWDGASILAGPEIVDDGVRTGDVRAHPVGAGMGITIQGADVVIAYQDGLMSDLVVSRGSTGSWTRTDARTGPTLDGFYNRFVAGMIATYSYDRSLAVPGDIVIVP